MDATHTAQAIARIALTAQTRRKYVDCWDIEDAACSILNGHHPVARALAAYASGLDKDSQPDIDDVVDALRHHGCDYRAAVEMAETPLSRIERDGVSHPTPLAADADYAPLLVADEGACYGMIDGCHRAAGLQAANGDDVVVRVAIIRDSHVAALVATPGPDQDTLITAMRADGIAI